MERAGPIIVADNGLADLLTAPAGHKLEVTEVWYVLAAGAATQCVTYLHLPAGYLFADVSAILTGRYSYVAIFNDLVLYAGDKLAVSVGANGAAWNAYCTYIDVVL